jgi:cobalt/nickel transport system permease protein
VKHDFLDKHAHIDSPVHRLDPRIKIISIFAAIVIIVTEPLNGTLIHFALYFGIIAIVVVLSRVPVTYILKRCLIVLPFILMASAFYPLSVVIEGEVQPSAKIDLYILPAIIIFSKALLAVLLLIILTSAERFHRLLLALRKLKMPRIIGTISALLYRYIFLLIDEALKTSRARESRTPGKLRMSRMKVYGNQIATIFIRSWDRSEIIYKSMLSRGFQGEYPGMEKLDLSALDLIISLLFMSGLLAVRLMV